MKSTSLCYHFDEELWNVLHRLQRLQKICSPVRSWESEAAAVLAELLGRSIRDNNQPAWPSQMHFLAFLYLIHFQFTRLHSRWELSCVWTLVMWTNSCFVKYVQQMRQNAELKHAPAADHVPNGIKDPKKIPSVFTQENENHLQNIYGRRSQWSSGVKRMIFHNFCIKASWPGTDRRQSLADASQCLPTNTNAWNNQFPSSKEYYDRNFLLYSGISTQNWLLLTFNPEFPAPG